MVAEVEVEEALWLILWMAAVLEITAAHQIPLAVAVVVPHRTAHTIAIHVSHVVAASASASDQCDVPPSVNKIVRHMAAALPSQSA